ncbi:MAG: periplasmic heavy metal sensor [Myxococcota bacterium]
MFGFILGAMCLVGLGAMARRRRYWRTYGGGWGPGGGWGCGRYGALGPGHGWHGPGGGYGPGGWWGPGGWNGPGGYGPGGGWGQSGGPEGSSGGYDYGPPRGPQWRGRWWRGGLFMMMRRLQLTPDQQTVVREELEQLGQTVQEHRGEWANSRRDVAQAIRGESFDATVMGELFGRHDEHLDAIRKAAMEALGRIHAVLDETQRQRLAELLEQGGRWHPFRGSMV